MDGNILFDPQRNQDQHGDGEDEGGELFEEVADGHVLFLLLRVTCCVLQVAGYKLQIPVPELVVPEPVEGAIHFNRISVPELVEGRDA